MKDIRLQTRLWSCRGLSLYGKITIIKSLSKKIQASFEKAYWKIEPLLEDEKELVSPTLRLIALNYIQRTSPNPPKALVKALSR